MSNNEISALFRGETIELKHITMKISYPYAINKLWYILYKIDQLILENATVCDNIHNKVCDVLEESFDDNNNYLEYTEYKLSNSTLPVIIGGHYRYSRGIDNYSEFVAYISYISYTYPPSQSSYGIHKQNNMLFKYNFDKPQAYGFQLYLNGFNQFMYNTTVIHNLTNNINSHQQNITIFKDNSAIIRENMSILNNNIMIHHEYIIKFKNNIKYLQEDNILFKNYIKYLEEYNILFKII